MNESLKNQRNSFKLKVNQFKKLILFKRIELLLIEGKKH